jgi:hypothetical protein
MAIRVRTIKEDWMLSKHESRFIGKACLDSGVPDYLVPLLLPYNMSNSVTKNEAIPNGKRVTKQGTHKVLKQEIKLIAVRATSNSPYTNAPQQNHYISTISSETQHLRAVVRYLPVPVL